MRLQLNSSSAAALVYALDSFFDNEHDKGQEGLGTEKTEELVALRDRILAGNYDLELTFFQAAIVGNAAGGFAENADEISEEDGYEAALVAIEEQVERSEQVSHLIDTSRIPGRHALIPLSAVKRIGPAVIVEDEFVGTVFEKDDAFHAFAGLVFCGSFDQEEDAVKSILATENDPLGKRL